MIGMPPPPSPKKSNSNTSANSRTDASSQSIPRPVNPTTQAAVAAASDLGRGYRLNVNNPSGPWPPLSTAGPPLLRALSTDAGDRHDQRSASPSVSSRPSLSSPRAASGSHRRGGGGSSGASNTSAAGDRSYDSADRHRHNRSPHRSSRSSSRRGSSYHSNQSSGHRHHHRSRSPHRSNRRSSSHHHHSRSPHRSNQSLGSSQSSGHRSRSPHRSHHSSHRSSRRSRSHSRSPVPHRSSRSRSSSHGHRPQSRARSPSPAHPDPPGRGRTRTMRSPSPADEDDDQSQGDGGNAAAEEDGGGGGNNVNVTGAVVAHRGTPSQVDKPRPVPLKSIRDWSASRTYRGKWHADIADLVPTSKGPATWASFVSQVNPTGRILFVGQAKALLEALAKGDTADLPIKIGEMWGSLLRQRATNEPKSYGRVTDIDAHIQREFGVRMYTHEANDKQSPGDYLKSLDLSKAPMVMAEMKEFFEVFGKDLASYVPTRSCQTTLIFFGARFHKWLKKHKVDLTQPGEIERALHLLDKEADAIRSILQHEQPFKGAWEQMAKARAVAVAGWAEREVKQDKKAQKQAKSKAKKPKVLVPAPMDPNVVAAIGAAFGTVGDILAKMGAADVDIERLRSAIAHLSVPPPRNSDELTNIGDGTKGNDTGATGTGPTANDVPTLRSDHPIAPLAQAGAGDSKREAVGTGESKREQAPLASNASSVGGVPSRPTPAPGATTAGKARIEMQNNAEAIKEKAAGRVPGGSVTADSVNPLAVKEQQQHRQAKKKTTSRSKKKTTSRSKKAADPSDEEAGDESAEGDDEEAGDADDGKQSSSDGSDQQPSAAGGVVAVDIAEQRPDDTPPLVDAPPAAAADDPTAQAAVASNSRKRGRSPDSGADRASKSSKVSGKDPHAEKKSDQRSNKKGARNPSVSASSGSSEDDDSAKPAAAAKKAVVKQTRSSTAARGARGGGKKKSKKK